MKNFIAVLFLFICSISYSQQDKLQGKWILDTIQYADGGVFPINHRFYSMFLAYSFYGNQMTVNERSSLATISQNSISSNARKINYKFEDSYLLLQDEGDDAILYLLKYEDFYEKYPEFKPAEIQFENKKVFVANQVVSPDFLKTQIFSEYIFSNINPNHSQVHNRNFKANFILSKDNVISDIVIIKSISKSFDKNFIKAVKSSQKYFSNKTGKDLLMTYEKKFYDWGGPESPAKAEVTYLLRTGDDYYNNNDFVNAIEIYEKLKLKNKPEVTQRGYEWTSMANIRLGIAYLAINNPEKACKLFDELGGRTNFNVRNYILNFCQ